MTARLEPIGFWSYARQDDTSSQGRLSTLRSRLRDALQQHYGKRQITIFQDVAAIPPGDEWERRIRDAIGSSTFLIPILTPSFIESEWCSTELRLFLERERQIWRDFPALSGVRRIFPIQYVPLNKTEPHNPADLTELRKLQWVDFQDLRHKSVEEEVVQVALDRIADSLCGLLQQPTSLPGDPAQAEPAAAAQAAEAARRAVADNAAAERASQAQSARAAEAAPARAETPSVAAPRTPNAPNLPPVSANRPQDAEAEAPRKTVVFDTAGASGASVVWSIARQAIAIGLVIWAIIIGFHVPSDLSTPGGTSAASGEVVFVVALLGVAGLLWRVGK